MPVIKGLQPINDRIIVRWIPESEISKGQFPTLQKLGVIAPDSAEEKETVCGTMIQYEKAAHKGEVVACGQGKWVKIRCGGCGHENVERRPMSVKPGDIIVFGRFADYGEDGLLVLQEDDVLAILTPRMPNDLAGMLPAEAVNG